MEPPVRAACGRRAQMPGQRITAQILHTSGNAHDTRGTGGTCTGDIAAVRSWLAGFGL